MTSTPLVSIIIPVYNGANYVGEAIQSALDQSYPNIEIIVVDDGSNDGGATRKAVEHFGDRVTYIVKPNGGVATALNTGIEHMHGELFSWLSHDDAYRPDKVARQVERWQSFGQACVVFGNFELMDANGNSLSVIDVGGRNLVARPLDAVFRGLINGCALLVPRELFDQAGLFEPGLPTTQDYHLWYRMARLVPFVHCPFVDVLQRTHAQQGSRAVSHLDEASRMFVHLIDSTPVWLMEAYEGSELRFLLRTRNTLTDYEGLQAYLNGRIGELMRKFRFSVVVRGKSANHTESVDACLQRLPYTPSEVVTVAPEGIDVAPGFRRVTCKSSRPADVVAAAEKAVHGDIVVFVSDVLLPSREQFRKACEALVAADADVAKPVGAPAALHEVDGLFVRGDALPRLGEFIEEAAFGHSPGTLQTTTYPFTDPAAVPSDDELSRALRGESRLDFNGLSASGVGGILDGLLQTDLPVILFLMHACGGGGQTLLKSLIEALRGKANTLVCYGTPEGEFRLSAGSGRSDMGVVFRLPESLPQLVAVLRRARVARVDVHHTIGFDRLGMNLLDALDVPFDVTLTDYHLVANHPYLCSDNGRYAGESDSSLLRLAPLPLLWKASRTIAISRDLAARMDRLCAASRAIPVRLWHESGVKVTHVFPPHIRPGEPLRIVICGNLAPHKGRQTVMDVAATAAKRNLPLRFHVLGEFPAAPAGLENTGPFLTLHGRYDSRSLSGALGGIAPHLGWLPSQAPETWSYALTDLLEAGLPVAATAHGAIPERVNKRPFTWLLPWDASVENWTDLFLCLHASSLTEPPRWVNISHLPPAVDFYFDEYLRPVRSRAAEV